ncbi:MAG: hypothetical protein K8S00_01135 [Bacteroidales bacterium]|nr:hypothetical protein [Bacteroidales bacterium]
MTDAEIKLELFRLIDNQPLDILFDIYDLLKTKFETSKRREINTVSDIDSQYKKMAKDQNREKEALEWIEGTLNTHES